MPIDPFQSTLLQWYERNKRDLPWRKTDDPYHIWLSEVILQQTRVEQGLPYYEKFVRNYPRVENLAEAELDKVLKDWEGLGYYSRARNLHHAAKQVVDELHGRFPDSYSELLNLKGVGDYTAAAVSSIAFDEARSVLDGNVYRVLARYFGISEPVNTGSGQKIFKSKAEEILFHEDPGSFNQALMEFGALQCLPRNPDCHVCPLQSGCKAFNMNMIQDLPVKKRKKYDRKRFLNYTVFNNDGDIYVERRPTDDIWGNLYQFWLYESTDIADQSAVISHINEQFELDVELNGYHQLKPHKLSHQSLHISILEVTVSKKPGPLMSRGQWIPLKALKTYAFPRPLRAFLDRNQLTLPLD